MNIFSKTKNYLFSKPKDDVTLHMGDKKYQTSNETKEIVLTDFEKKVAEAVSKQGTRVLILGEYDLPHKENGEVIKTRRYRIRCLTTGKYFTIEKDLFKQLFEF